jgi:hypothetical protein
MTGGLSLRGRSPLPFNPAEELMAGGLGHLTTASIYFLPDIAVLTAHLDALGGRRLARNSPAAMARWTSRFDRIASLSSTITSRR